MQIDISQPLPYYDFADQDLHLFNVIFEFSEFLNLFFI